MDHGGRSTRPWLSHTISLFLRIRVARYHELAFLLPLSSSEAE
jgi:hypothetical protein